MQKETDKTQQPPAKKRTGKTWLIILIVIIALFLLFRACSDKDESKTSTATSTNNSVQSNANKKLDSSFPVGLHYEKTTNNTQALNLMKRVKTQVADLTNNPEKVEFKDLFYLNQNNKVAICGEINTAADNEKSQFKRIISNGRQDVALEGQTKGFQQVWEQVCVEN